jgi:hypothetical protein
MNINQSYMGAVAALCSVVALTSIVRAEEDTDPRSSGGGSCAKSAYNCLDAPNPLP